MNRQDFAVVLKKALQDESYEVADEDTLQDLESKRRRIGETYVPQRILTIGSSKSWGIQEPDAYSFNFSPRGTPIHEKGKPGVCACCGKYQSTTKVSLTFQTYHQFEEFFGKMPEDVPWQFKEYLSLNFRKHVGNPILEDVDPVDTIDHLWFSSAHVKGAFYSTEQSIAMAISRLERLGHTITRCIKVHTVVCNKCFNHNKPAV